MEGEALVKLGMRKIDKDCTFKGNEVGSSKDGAFGMIEVEKKREMGILMPSDVTGCENLGEAGMKISKSAAKKKRRDMEYRKLADLSGFENLKALMEGEALIKRRKREQEEKRGLEFHAPKQIHVAAAVMEKETVEEISLEPNPEKISRSSVILVTSSEERNAGRKENDQSGMITDQTGLGNSTYVMEDEAFKKCTRRKRKKKRNKTINAQQLVPVDVPREGEQGLGEIVGISSSRSIQESTAESLDNAVLRTLLRKPRYFDPPVSNWTKCQKCGEEDHEAANCRFRKKIKPCHLCGSLIHNSKYCKKKHAKFLSKNSFDFNACLRCGNEGHDLFSCRSGYCPDDLKDIQCYVCRSFGHLCCVNAPDPSPREISCYRCGQSGHLGNDCRTSFLCYKCGEKGHFARNCVGNGKVRLEDCSTSKDASR